MHKSIINKRIGSRSALVIATGIMLLSSTQAHAEYFGFPNGRSADIGALPDSSVEAGFLTGDIGEASYQSFGGRFNFRVSPEVMLFGDIAQTEIEDGEGLAYGAGLYYPVKGIAKNNDFAVKLSYHTITLEPKDSRFDGEEDGNVLSIEGLLSGDKIGESNLNWYANFGMHKFDFDGYDETEIGFGGGVFSATSFGEFYAGIDLIDEMTFGVGIN